MFSDLLLYFYRFLAVDSAVAQILILFFLFRYGPARRFIVVAIYVFLDLTANLSETLADAIYRGWAPTNAAIASEGQKLYTHLFWVDEVVLDLMLFITVIVLTYKALEQSPIRGAIGKLLAGVLAVALLLPFVVFHPTFTPWPKGTWFNSTSQMLNFGGAIMNLALWTALISSKRRDPQLLTVSAGLGVVVTGAAISFGMRHFIPLGGFRWLADVFLLLTHLCGLVIWCWAFRPSAKVRRVQIGALQSL